MSIKTRGGFGNPGSWLRPSASGLARSAHFTRRLAADPATDRNAVLLHRSAASVFSPAAQETRSDVATPLQEAVRCSCSQAKVRSYCARALGSDGVTNGAVRSGARTWSRQVAGPALGGRAAPARPEPSPPAPVAAAAARQPGLPGSSAAAPGGAAPLRRRSGGAAHPARRAGLAAARRRGAAGAGAGAVSRVAGGRRPAARAGAEPAAAERGAGRLRAAEPPRAVCAGRRLPPPAPPVPGALRLGGRAGAARPGRPLPGAGGAGPHRLPPAQGRGHHVPGAAARIRPPQPLAGCQRQRGRHRGPGAGPELPSPGAPRSHRLPPRRKRRHQDAGRVLPSAALAAGAALPPRGGAQFEPLAEKRSGHRRGAPAAPGSGAPAGHGGLRALCQLAGLTSCLGSRWNCVGRPGTGLRGDWTVGALPHPGTSNKDILPSFAWCVELGWEGQTGGGNDRDAECTHTFLVHLYYCACRTAPGLGPYYGARK